MNKSNVKSTFQNKGFCLTKRQVIKPASADETKLLYLALMLKREDFLRGRLWACRYHPALPHHFHLLMMG